VRRFPSCATSIAVACRTSPARPRLLLARSSVQTPLKFGMERLEAAINRPSEGLLHSMADGFRIKTPWCCMPGDWTSFRDRQRLEELWRFRLVEARIKHEKAVAGSRAASRDFEARQPPPSDGNLTRALMAERAARDEYMRVLRIFTDLMVTGKRPEE